MVGRGIVRKFIDDIKRKGAEGGKAVKNGQSEMEDEEQEKMESREGGSVILQFILEEQLLPRLSDGYQLPQDRETQGS